MTIYTKTIIAQGKERLVITLTMLGATTKPYFLAELCHYEAGRLGDRASPLSFFLQQLDEPTEAVDAVVALARGLIHFATTNDLMQTKYLAQRLATTCNTSSWSVALSECLLLEVEQSNAGTSFQSGQ